MNRQDRATTIFERVRADLAGTDLGMLDEMALGRLDQVADLLEHLTEQRKIHEGPAPFHVGYRAGLNEVAQWAAQRVVAELRRG